MTTLRSTIFDGRVQPVINLALNPDFSAVSPGTTVIRRNLCRNPKGLTAISDGNFAVALSSGTVDRNVSYANRSDWVRFTRSNPSNNIFRTYVALSDLVDRATYSISYLVANDGAQAITVYLDWCDSAVGQATHVIQPGETKRISASGVRGVYDTIFRFADFAFGPVGSSLLVTDILIERASDPMPFFDGATVDSTGVAYAWEGTPNASVSAAKALVSPYRTNRVQNPSFEVDTSTWSAAGTGGTAVLSRVTDQSYAGAACLKVECSASASLGAFTSGRQTGLTAGVSYTASLYVKGEAGKLLRLELGFLDASAAIIGSRFTTANIAATGSWQRLSVTALAPANTVFSDVVIRNAAAVVHTFYVDAVLVEESLSALGFFDGTSNFIEPEVVASWSGTPHASASQLSTPLPVNVTSLNAARHLRGWTPRGYAVRGFPNSTSTATEGWVVVAGSPGSGLSGQGITFEPGKTYTALVSVYLPAPLTSTDLKTRMLTVSYNSQAGWTGAVRVDSNRPPNVAGWYDLRLTFTIPANAVWAGIRLGVGSGVGSGEVYWDKFMLVEGVYTGTYVDGSQPGAIWRGAPNNSVSVGYPPSVA